MRILFPGFERLCEKYGIVSVTPLLKGWSGDQKYCVTTVDGTKYLLRITPKEKAASRPECFRMQQVVAALDAEIPVKRIKLIATDGATNYMSEFIDSMDEETFLKWVEYHLATCERQDLIGASHHVLDILRKV